MCTNGVNTEQLGSALTQIDEAVALCRRWTHRAYHRADDAGLAKTADTLAEAQALLDEVRARLDEAGETLEEEGAHAPSVTVKAV